MIPFWRWMTRGTGGTSGSRRFVDRWLVVHLTVGVAIAHLVPIPLQEAATTLLIPVAGVFVGLAFAWGGSAHSLLQSSEVEAVAKHKNGGLEDYVYAFQAAILLVLLTLVAWAIVGLGIVDYVWPTPEHPLAYAIVGVAMFSLSSAMVRECWHVVLAVQMFLLIRIKVRQVNETE